MAPTAEPVIVVAQPGRQTLHLVLTGRLVLGRECDGLLLTDAQVSRRHLELHATERGVVCTDLGSTNGSFLDGARITTPVVLLPGGVVTVGTTSISLADTRAGPQPSDDGAPATGTPELRRTSIDVVADRVEAGGWRPRADAGTVTILFSDIEASTERVSRLGDAAWVDVLEIHNSLIRDELARAGGREVHSMGDGFMLTFPSVRGALQFSVAVQTRLAATEAGDPEKAVRVRMGLHTGEVMTDETGDLFGRHVHKAARVAGLAAGGQVLVSATVREIAAGDTEFSFGEPSSHQLKGLEGTHVVHELEWRT